MIHQLVYYSFSPDGGRFIEDILHESRKRNAQDGITGLLIYHDQNFCQILEGEKSKVEALYKRIEADPRHDCVALIYRGAAAARQFPNWSLALATSDRARLGDVFAVTKLEDVAAASSCCNPLDSVSQALVCVFLRKFVPISTP